MIKYGIGLWQRRWLILLLAWVLALAGWVGLRLLPDVYESKAQLYFNTGTASSAAVSDVTTSVDYDRRIASLQLQLLSRENIETVIYETGLDAELPDDAALQRRVESLQEGIKIRSPQRSYFNIAYQDRDPVIAQKVVSSIINLFIEQDLAAVTLEYESGLVKINQLIDETFQRISEKNQEIADFQEANASVLSSATRNQRLMEQKEAEISRLEYDISAGTQRRNTILSQLNDTPKYAAGGELDALKLELARLRSVYNDNYPDIQQLQARIAEMEGNGSALPDNPDYARLTLALSAVDGELTTLRNRSSSVRKELSDLSVAATRVPAVMAQLQNIQLGKDQLEREYQKLLEERSRLTNSSRMGDLGGVVKYEIYESPKVAAIPTAPPRGLLTLFIVIAALGIAVGLAFLLSQVDRTYTQGEDLEDAFGLPVLGQISPSETAGVRQAKWLERAGLGASFCVLIGLSCMMFLVLEQSKISKNGGAVFRAMEHLLLPQSQATVIEGAVQ